MALIAAGCASPGEVRFRTGRRAAESHDGLHLIQTWGGSNQRAYARPGVDLRPYDRVMLDPVVVRFAINSERVPSAETVELMKRRFREIFLQALEASTVHALVDEPGEGVLRVSPQLTDIVLGAGTPASPRERVYVNSVGAVTLALEVSDSRTHAVLVRAFDRRPIGSGSGAFSVSAARNQYEAEVLFQRWAARLRGWLDQVREIPPLPAES